MTATATHGSKAGLLVNGYDLSPFHNSLGIDDSIEAVEDTSFGPLTAPVIAKSYIFGMGDGTLDAQGKYLIDKTGLTLDQIADVLEAAIGEVGGGAPRAIATYFPLGDGFGNGVRGVLSDITKYDISSPVSAIVSVATSFQSSVGIEPLNVLRPIGNEVAGSVNGADLDAGATYDATKWKGVSAYLHVLAAAGAPPNVACKVQHSSDGTTWVDLVTFTAVTAAHAAQRIQVLGTVNRHLRAQLVLTAGTTATVHIAAGRVPA